MICLIQLHGVTVFLKIDLRSRYHQVRIKDEDIFKTTVRQISALQLKRAVRKSCKAYAVTVTNEENLNNTEKLKFEDIPVLKEYADLFLKEIPGLPPKRELDFTI